MQFNIASLCLLAFSLPATIAQRTEENAVTIKTFPNQIGCGWGLAFAFASPTPTTIPQSSLIDSIFNNPSIPDVTIADLGVNETLLNAQDFGLAKRQTTLKITMYKIEFNDGYGAGILIISSPVPTEPGTTNAAHPLDILFVPTFQRSGRRMVRAYLAEVPDKPDALLPRFKFSNDWYYNDRFEGGIDLHFDNDSKFSGFIAMIGRQRPPYNIGQFNTRTFARKLSSVYSAKTTVPLQ
ncbi:hypothetical protein FAUST_7156 [Fusarium austroamericanum]|uniref:Uncharacterized protein n=1 Tax=Fusarium austroamericanum TaxID=282268 RepID=A0AAN5Z714_FUSAU|nr:hypothetical protein FAUST_7156 [Fusarium austroamericanum]